MAATTTYPFLSYDANGAFLEGTGIDRDQLAALYPRLDALRGEFLRSERQSSNADGDAAQGIDQQDAGFFELPERMLGDYQRRRHQSELGRILKVSHRFRETIDRVVVLGTRGSHLGGKALMDACCDPYFNELTRGQRGSRPRTYFEGSSLDNDACQGLLHLLGAGMPTLSVDDRWAIILVHPTSQTIETAAAFGQCLAALRYACRQNPQLLSELVVPVTGRSGRLLDLAKGLGCQDVFELPDHVSEHLSVFSAAGVLPAAVVGLNVVELLTGAIMMNEHFRNAPVAENVVLNYVGVCHLWEKNRGIAIRALALWAKALESFGLWHDQLVAESLGNAGRGITTVSTPDMPARGRQRLEGRADKLITNVIIETWRCDALPLPVGPSEWDLDGLNEYSDRTLPEFMAAAIAGTNQVERAKGRPTADIRLPQIREATLGQLMQMMMIATAIEARLIGMNPYEQRGMEAYTTNMMKALRAERE